MYFKTQKFLVAGISRSGVSAAEFLLARGASVFLYDDVSGGAVEKSERALEQKGARILGPEDLSAAVRDCGRAGIESRDPDRPRTRHRL